MDKTGIIVVSLCVVLLGWWFIEQKKMAEEQARFAAAHPPIVQTNWPAASPTNAAAMATTATVNSSTAIFASDAPEQTLVFTNGRARYTFTSQGGGLKKIELLDYPETVSARWRNQITNANAGVATLNNRTTVPVLAILGGETLIGDGNFILSKTTTGVLAQKDFPNGLRLTKQFQFSSNFLLNASVRFENNSNQPLNLPAHEIVVGTAEPMDVDDISAAQNEGAMWFDGTTAQDQPLAWFSGAGFACSRGTPKSEFRAGTGNVVWASAHNQFFALVLMPKEAAQQIVARPLMLPRFQDAGWTNSPAPQGIQTALVYPAQTLTANSSLERQITIFAGPKEYRTLAQIGDQFQNHADQVMNFGTGFASFWGVGTFFAKLLLSAMNALHDVTHLGYGWTIVLITILIKILFWPLTAKSVRSMKKMQALAPELNSLKDKYKDDVQKLTQKQWEIYKKNGVNPMSGCLPMLVQMPVFIGFFIMIRSAIELRGAHFLWVSDLSKPDTLFMIPGLDFPFNLLPLLMGASMLWQSHMTPPSPGMDPAQQKMMRWLPLIFLVFLYNYSSGLALYWTVNNVLTVIQTKLTNATVKIAPPESVLTPASKKKK